MSHRYRKKRPRRCRRSKVGGPIKRVVRGLSSRLGVGRHVVIAGFVLGFIFVPLLTLLLFLAALYWVHHPERAEEAVDRFWRKARHAFRGSDREPAYAGAGSGDAAIDDDGDLDFAELRRRFDDLERRAESMEEYVASEEHALDREFHRMRDEEGG